MVRAHPDPPHGGLEARAAIRRSVDGGVAQLGEHLLCKQGVIGSIPFTSTKTTAMSGQNRRYPVGTLCSVLFSAVEIGCSLTMWKK
jgi:hypothetical protein